MDDDRPYELLYLNGSYLALDDGRVSVEDRGFELSDSVYEVIKVMNGRTVWLEDHLARLERSLAAALMPRALDGHPLAEIIPHLVARSQVGDGFVYVQVTRGASPRDFSFPPNAAPTVVCYARTKLFPQPGIILQGVRLHPVTDIRWARCDIKSTNLLASVLAKHEAHEAGAWEALYVADDGTVREGGSSNAFALIAGVLRTHPADNRILNGITRVHVLDIARRMGVPVHEEAFFLADVLRQPGPCTEFFTASTTTDIMPIVSVGGVTIGAGRPGPTTLALLNSLRAEQAALVGREPPAALTVPA
jgi:D-alanine transaminase